MKLKYLIAIVSALLLGFAGFYITQKPDVNSEEFWHGTPTIVSRVRPYPGPAPTPMIDRIIADGNQKALEAKGPHLVMVRK
jgi:hypothetical protein